MKKLALSLVAALSLLAALFLGVSAASAAPITDATTVTGIPNTPVERSYGVAADDQYVWYTNGYGGTNNTGYVTRVNIDANEVTDINSSYFSNPKGIATTGTKVFVANNSFSPSGSVVMIDIATGAVNNITDPRIVVPFAVIWDGSHVIVANDNSGGVGLVILDGNGNIVSSVTDASLLPYDYGFNAAISSDGTSVWVASTTSGGTCGGGCLVKVDIASATVTGVYTGNGLLSSPDVAFVAGGKVYMADDINATQIDVFDTTTLSFSVLTNAVFDDMYSAVSDGSTVYLAQSPGCPTDRPVHTDN